MGEWIEELLFKWIQSFCLGDEKVLEVDSGELHKIVKVLNAT